MEEEESSKNKTNQIKKTKFQDKIENVSCENEPSESEVKKARCDKIEDVLQISKQSCENILQEVKENILKDVSSNNPPKSDIMDLNNTEEAVSVLDNTKDTNSNENPDDNNTASTSNGNEESNSYVNIIPAESSANNTSNGNEESNSYVNIIPVESSANSTSNGIEESNPYVNIIPAESSANRRKRANRNYRSQLYSSSSSVDEDMINDDDDDNSNVPNPDLIDVDDNDNDSTASEDDSSNYSSNNNMSSSESNSNSSHDRYSDIMHMKSEILSKIKPKYTWSAVPEFFNRQLGLSSKGQRSSASKNSVLFQYRLSGSLHPVERLELMYKLDSHKGCVNSLNFNRSGSLLVSGSDDLKIIIWKWASNEIAHRFDSGHNSNVFQTKFMDLGSEINIVSSARDGQVRHAVVPSSCGQIISTALFKHPGAVHKIALSPNSPWEILTAGEDGHVIRCDLRDKHVEKLISVKVNNRKIPLYSIAANPLDPEFCVCGRDQFIRVYDKRYVKTSVKKLAPAHLLSRRSISTLITSAVYNYLGTEILASYSDDDIYLFDNKNYTPGVYLHKYQGHNNTATIKGVNFFGPRSEFIISGSDCSNCFFWDKNTEAIVQWMPGDEAGVVNCLEPHPGFPILATSGLDHDIKVWVPSCEKPPTLEGLNKCIHRNISTRNSNVFGMDVYDNQTINVFVRQCLRNRNRQTENCPYGTSSDDDDDEEDNDDFLNGRSRYRSLPCSPS